MASKPEHIGCPQGHTIIVVTNPNTDSEGSKNIDRVLLYSTCKTTSRQRPIYYMIVQDLGDDVYRKLRMVHIDRYLLFYQHFARLAVREFLTSASSRGRDLRRTGCAERFQLWTVSASTPALLCSEYFQ